MRGNERMWISSATNPSLRNPEEPTAGGVLKDARSETLNGPD